MSAEDINLESDNVVWDDYQKLSDALQGPFQLEDKRFDPMRTLMKDLFDRAMDEFYDYAKDNMSDWIAGRVRECTERSIESVLEGNEKEFRRWINADYRYDNTSVIHGRLFESGPEAIRKKIVDAYPDVLKSARILDLEHQLDLVVKQATKLQTQINDMRDRGYV